MGRGVSSFVTWWILALGAAALAVLGCGGGTAHAGHPGTDPGGQTSDGETKWEALKIGAGGWLVGMDIDASGSTYVVRADTYGAYVSDGVTPWRQVVTAASMPAADVASMAATNSPWYAAGVYEIRVAPTEANRLYMIFPGSGYSALTVYRSDDRGTTWRRAGTGYDTGGTLDANDPAYRYVGRRMAVDPANPDVVYAGSDLGLFVTFDGGASWTQVSGVPAPTPSRGGIAGILFDPASGTTSGRTNRIYAFSQGNGMYLSTDAGGSWTAAPAGGPTACTDTAVDSSGRLFATAWVGVRDGLVYRFVQGAWASAPAHPDGPANGEPGAIAVDPTPDAQGNADRVFAVRGSGHLSVSTDHGATFSGWNWTQTRSATDVPWLQSANVGPGQSLAVLCARFDPVKPHRLWFAEGIGVWFNDGPSATASNTLRSFSAGIEQLVGTDVCVPPGSPYVFVAAEDKGVLRTLRSNTAYPTSTVTMGHGDPLIPGWAVNYSWMNPQHLVGVLNAIAYGVNAGYSGYSLDGGATWTQFPTQPAPGWGGDIIAPSIDNVIMVVGVDGKAYRTTDRGASWTQLASVPESLHAGYFSVLKHILAIDGGYDGATNRTLYLYAARSGTWRSTDDGASWSRVSTLTLAGDYYGVKLRAVPGQPGHLFLVQGRTGDSGHAHPWDGTYLYRSTDGGASWTQVPGVGEPYDVAIGAAAPGQAYPAIYFAGWYQGVWGLWRSVDDAATWTQIGPYPGGSLDMITTLAASRDTYGEVYAAFQGSGWAKGSLR